MDTAGKKKKENVNAIKFTFGGLQFHWALFTLGYDKVHRTKHHIRRARYYLTLTGTKKLLFLRSSLVTLVI